MVKKNVKGESLKKVVVAGDVAVDWFEVRTPPSSSGHEETMFNWQNYPGVKRFAKPGGAQFLADIVRTAISAKVLAPELKNLENLSAEKIIHSFVSLDKFPYSTSKKDEHHPVYRVNQYEGFAGPDEGNPSVPAVKDDDPDADVVILDDAGNGFRDTQPLWPAALRKGKKPLVVIKMSDPIAKGLLWEEINTHHADRTVAVISADDLRQEEVQISRRLSWERTAKDFVWQMASNRSLMALNACAFLIVRFGLDGAILYKRRGGVVESRLFFDPKIGEDGFCELYPGKMLGMGCVFVAALAAEITKRNLEGVEEGVRQGLLSSRRLWQLGFGKDVTMLDYPGSEIFDPLDKDEFSIADVVIPNPTAIEPADPDYWCILDDLAQAGLENVAYHFVIHGKDSSLDKVPIGQFRNLTTFDRSEIESFRSIKNLIHEYLSASEVSRPLSMAVFGAPGSGKSFGVTEVAESVAPGRLDKPLEFNLSQFKSTADLIAAFHRVRDAALGGKIPIVFFDEFDSELEGKLGWLKYFLAPMQDGKFRDGEAMHPIGRAIFVFAGGTCCTFKEFCKEQGDQGFKNAKGPDFVSRLRGYVDIKGPNPLNENDALHLIRRAQLLRFLLQKNAKNIFDGKICRIDPGVLRALIKVPEYKHGIRSMLAIIEMSLLAGRKTFEQAALPSPEQLELHVDAEMFSRLVVRNVLLGGAREVLAKAIHENYLNDLKKRKLKNPKLRDSLVPWEELSEDLKETNRQQADDIPEKLKPVGCDFAPVLGRKPKLFRFNKNEIKIMAEMEHNRWNTQKFLAGWSYAKKKDPLKKTHPSLVAWRDLTPKEQDKDIAAVRGIPQLLASAKFEIYRLKRK